MGWPRIPHLDPAAPSPPGWADAKPDFVRATVVMLAWSAAALAQTPSARCRSSRNLHHPS